MTKKVRITGGFYEGRIGTVYFESDSVVHVRISDCSSFIYVVFIGEEKNFLEPYDEK